MSFIIDFVITVFISAAILSALPFVKYKNFHSCLKTSALVAIISIPMAFLKGFIAVLAGFFLALIPIFGWLAIPFVYFLIAAVFCTLSLYIADQIIEDLEIPTILETFCAALAIAGGKLFIVKTLALFF